MRIFWMAAMAAFAFAAPASAYTDQEISNALMANAWCSFSYNQTTGYSHSKRGVFSADGSLNERGRQLRLARAGRRALSVRRRLVGRAHARRKKQFERQPDPDRRRH